MKINSEVALVGNQIILVPYKEKHVPRYHEWMQSPELLEQTASERLMLQQEYDMQQSWLNDENKCTFIVLDKQKWNDNGNNEIESMAGDVNLFFNDPDDLHVAEIEIMIAGISKLHVNRFTAKIGHDNEPSLSLFNKLGFTKISESEVFKEVTLKFDSNNFTNLTADVTELHYPIKTQA
ncbi:N-acetyltransferase 9-like protein isoform X2 [Nematostella vectensis]|uniref:N-acetyltransferase 9-like protein isoform X2 n=1 Tax=Nematostella vectensis TaxID=45351 RepID=UPI0013906E9A|nr:N-acetyltransferase 9-like protein isoform X2 [Nematostella vectensis]